MINRGRRRKVEMRKLSASVPGWHLGNSLSTEELFDGSKIKPLKSPPRLQIVGGGGSDEIEKVGSVPSPQSPRSAFAHGKKMFREAISSSSPREKKYSDPFTAAIEATRKESIENESQGGRGRGRVVSGSSPSSIRKGRTRSLSPLRVSDIRFVPEEDDSHYATTTPKKQTQEVEGFSLVRVVDDLT